jgi:predicted enzyme related to lactoylglutathione lyase
VKVLVQDLTAAAQFYRSIAGLEEAFRHQTKSGAFEIALKGKGGEPGFIIMEYAEPQPNPQSNVVLVFSTDDAVAFGRRIVEAGGKILHDVQQVSAMSQTFAIVLGQDPEGNALEAVQQN